MTELLDQVVWIKIIEFIPVEADRKKALHALMMSGKKQYLTLKNGVFNYFKNKWRRWFSRPQECFNYVYQGLSIEYLDGIFLMFKNSIHSPLITGKYINNAESGEWKRYFYNGNIESISYYSEDGCSTKIGEHICYSLEGEIVAIYNYNNNGDLDGTQYIKSGITDTKKEAIENYSEGKKNGKSVCILNGIIVFECNYLEGKKHGICLEKFSNGNIMRESGWDHGKRHGEYIEYHSNGKMLMKGIYNNDLPVGKHELWWPNGNMSSIVNYGDNGIPNGEIVEFNLKGEIKRRELIL